VVEEAAAKYRKIQDMVGRQSTVEEVGKWRAGAAAAKVGLEVWKERRTLADKLKSVKFWVVVVANVALAVFASMGVDPQKCAEMMGMVNAFYLGGQSVVDAVRNYNKSGDLAAEAWGKREELKEKMGSRKLWVMGLSNGLLVTLTMTLGLNPDACMDLVMMITGTYLAGQSLAGAAGQVKG
jgi:hypothetical protein